MATCIRAAAQSPCKFRSSDHSDDLFGSTSTSASASASAWKTKRGIFLASFITSRQYGDTKDEHRRSLWPSTNYQSIQQVMMLSSNQKGFRRRMEMVAMISRRHDQMFSTGLSYSPLLNRRCQTKLGSRRHRSSASHCPRRVYAIASEPTVTKEESVAVLIVGAGIAGLATALALHKVGIRSLVLEKASSIRGEGSSLGFWTNGWRALDALGIADDLRRQHVVQEKIQFRDSSSRILREIVFNDCEGGPHEMRGILRSRLLSGLANALPPESVRFDAEVVNIRQASDDNEAVVVKVKDGVSFRTKALIGCDGVNSKVAAWLGLPKAQYAGYMAYRGVAEYPSGIKNGVDCIQQYLGQGIRLGMYPLNDKELYWFTCYNCAKGQVISDVDARKSHLLQMIDGWDRSIIDAVTLTSPEAIAHSVIGDRKFLPLPGARWGRGCVTLAGDAAHPMTPNLGQGGAMALEDAVVLARQLASSGLVVNRVDGLKSQSQSQSLSKANDSELVVGFPTFKPTLAGGGGGDGGGRGGGGNDESAVETSFEEVAAAIARYEKERMRRCATLTLRSFAIGKLLQLPNASVCYVRDNIAIPYLVIPDLFLEHTRYDCGNLPLAGSNTTTS